MTGASPHSGQATVTVAVGLSRSLSATIITLTPHLQRHADTIVITVPQILRGGHITSKHFSLGGGKAVGGGRKMGHFGGPEWARPPRVVGGENVAAPTKVDKGSPTVN
jgi:hypothetical protein